MREKDIWRIFQSPRGEGSDFLSASYELFPRAHEGGIGLIIYKRGSSIFFDKEVLFGKLWKEGDMGVTSITWFLFCRGVRFSTKKKKERNGFVNLLHESGGEKKITLSRPC